MIAKVGRRIGCALACAFLAGLFVADGRIGWAVFMLVSMGCWLHNAYSAYQYHHDPKALYLNREEVARFEAFLRDQGWDNR